VWLCLQDIGDDEGEHDSGRSETDEDVDSTPQPQSQYYINPQGAPAAHHTLLGGGAPPPLQGSSPTPLMNPAAVNGSNHIDEHPSLPPQPYLGMPMPMVPTPTAAPVPASAPSAAPAPAPAPTQMAAPVPAPPQSVAAPAQQAPVVAAPAQAPVAAAQAAAPEEHQEAACVKEEHQEESGDQGAAQGGPALQAQGEAAESEVQANQQPKEEASDDKRDFEELQLQESGKALSSHSLLGEGWTNPNFQPVATC